MKFFTPEVSNFESYADFKAVQAVYRARLKDLSGILPAQVLALAELEGMQDGLIAKVDYDRDRGVLKLTLRCGHLQMGYYNLELTYIGAELTPCDDLTLAKAARSTHSQSRHGCDFAYHEIDVADDAMIEHRLLFHALDWYHPKAGGWTWFTIRCRDLKWRQVPTRSRRLSPSRDRYPSGPVE